MKYKIYHDQVITSDMKYTEVEDGDIFDQDNILYLFGDNVLRAGKGGQAVVRGARNSVGILTKRLPSNREDAFLTDDVLDLTSGLILQDLRNVIYLLDTGEYDLVHIPSAGLGTGLADMKNKCPKTFNFLSHHLYRMLGFKNPGWDGTR